MLANNKYSNCLINNSNKSPSKLLPNYYLIITKLLLVLFLTTPKYTIPCCYENPKPLTAPNDWVNSVAFNPTNGCIAVRSGTPSRPYDGNIYIYKNYIATIKTNKTQICQGDSTTLTANPSGGSAPYTYQWYKDGSQISGETAPTLDVSQAGSYTVTIIDKDGQGCQATSEKVIITINKCDKTQNGSKLVQAISNKYC